MNVRHESRPAKWSRLLAIVFFAGVALRAYHYGRNPAVWHDEGALVLNVLKKSYMELLGPLEYFEAAPPLFLWAERAVVDALGDSTYALRLLPFLGSCVTLALVAIVSRALLGTATAIWATLLIAVSDRLLWHACEAKPYALDALCAAALHALSVHTRSWSVGRQVLVVGSVASATIWLAYPGCFLIGGYLLSLVPRLCRERKCAAWAGWTAVGLIAVASFTALYVGPVNAQRCAEMDECWTRQFPDWLRPWSVPVWTIASTADALRYCFAPSGYLFIGFVVIGVWRLGRAAKGDFLILALAPLVLNVMAAWLHGYPFGGARVVVYASPGLAIITAAGIGPGLAWLAWRTRWSFLLAGTTIALPVGLSAYRVVKPWERHDTRAAAAYVHAHRRWDDKVFTNHWEVEYYFRRDVPDFALLPSERVDIARRFWLVLASAHPKDRHAILSDLARGRRVADVREFRGATVALVEKPD